MGYYVIAVGGTGNKILESIVYGACADAFYELDKKSRRIPIPMVRLLAVDVDAACGNTTRAKQAAEYYERVRKTYEKNPVPRRGFHTELRVDRWNMNLSKRATSVERMVQNHKQDQLLARTLFDKTEAALEYSEGFRGHPDLGVLFFADLLSGLEETAKTGQPDEMVKIIREMQAEIDRGDTVKVILCGSIFGGTGAAGIPSISQYLRNRFERFSGQFELASVLMLPYYKVPASSQNEELEIVVKSSTFLDKARTALQYYGMEGMIRNDENDPVGVYDAVYLLGLPPEAFITTRIYSTGSQSQENDAHMLEWLAMRCVARFFRTGFRGEDSHNIDCYYYQLHSRTFSWESFDEEADLYRVGFGGLLKAATAFFAECYPYLRARISGERKGRGNAVNYYAAWFHNARRFSGPDRAKLEKDLDALYHCLAFYGNWAYQIVRTLPPTLRKDRVTEEAAKEAALHYDQVVDRAVLLSQRKRALQSTGLEKAEQAAYQQLEEEYEEMLKRQHAITRRIGGSMRLEILKNAQTLGREKLTAQEQAVADLARQISEWQGEDSYLIDERSLRQEKERLSAMERVKESLREKLEKIGQDIEAAIRENIVSIEAQFETEMGEELPENDLFDPGMLSALHELLTLYGLKYEARDYGRTEELCHRLQKGIDRLIVHRIPDRVDMTRMIAGVGGGTASPKTPDAMLAGFWAALQNASLEEENV